MSSQPNPNQAGQLLQAEPPVQAPASAASDFPPLPEQAYWSPGAFDPLFTADQMHAYVLADRAARAVAVERELIDLRQSLDFYKRRCELLQTWQSKMRDPERTIVCDILANGQTLPDVDGSRYLATQPPAPLKADDAGKVVGLSKSLKNIDCFARGILRWLDESSDMLMKREDNAPAGYLANAYQRAQFIQAEVKKIEAALRNEGAAK